MKSCSIINDDYEMKFWTDATMREFIKNNFDWALENYDAYPYGIQRVDAFRYFVLYYYGGYANCLDLIIIYSAYIDLDIGCKKKFDPLLKYEVILPLTKPFGVSNDFMMASPKHPFMLELINSLPKYNHYYGTKYPTVMVSTGPLFLTIRAALFEKRSEISYLTDNLYNGGYESFVYHVHGSSWHGSDAFFVFLLYNNLSLVISCLVVLCAIFLIVVCLFCAIYKLRRVQTVLPTSFDRQKNS